MESHNQRFHFKNLYPFQGYKFREAFLVEEDILVSLNRTSKTGKCPVCGRRCNRIHMSRKRRIRDLDLAKSHAYIEFEAYELTCRCGYEGWEENPICDEYSRYTRRFEEKVVIFAQRMTLKDVAAEMCISWNAVKNIDKKALRKLVISPDEWSPTKIGVDEIAYQKGQKYLTIVRDVDAGKVLWVGIDRKKETLDKFFAELGIEKCQKIRYAVLDMWDPFIASIQANTDAQIIFDKFHIAKAVTEAVDSVRKDEFGKADEIERKEMKHKRFLILARQDRLPQGTRETLMDLLKLNEKLYTAYLLKEQILDVFDEPSQDMALKRIWQWIESVAASGVEQFQTVVKTIRNYFFGIANYFICRITNAQSEGFNNKINVLKRKAYGFRDIDYFGLKILQTCRGLSSK